MFGSGLFKARWCLPSYDDEAFYPTNILNANLCMTEHLMATGEFSKRVIFY